MMAGTFGERGAEESTVILIPSTILNLVIIFFFFTLKPRVE